MKLTNSFRIDRPAGEVFDAFRDIERVATCIPGSQVLGRSGDDVYDGEVKVKVGPLGVTYTGQLRVLETDAEQRRLTMRAKGREKRGAGNADAYVVARLSQDDGQTVVDIDTDLSIRGKVAQFGRGVISDVSAEIMQTFASNVERMLEHGESTPAAATEQDVAPAVAAQQATADAPPDGDGLDAWALVVRPLLRRHGRTVATVACSGATAYLGAYLGARRALRRRGPARRRR